MDDDRKRLGLTLTGVYIGALDRLVNEGIYLEYQEGIRDALIMLFEHYGIEPFCWKNKEDGKEEVKCENA